MQSLVVPMNSANKKLLKFKRNNEPCKVFLMMAQSISDVFVWLILDNIEMDILILLRAQTWLLLAMRSIKLPCACHISYDGLFASPTNPLLFTFFACIMVATNCSDFTRSSTYDLCNPQQALPKISNILCLTTLKLVLFLMVYWADNLSLLKIWHSPNDQCPQLWKM